jgi:hypothetical protein
MKPFSIPSRNRAGRTPLRARVAEGAGRITVEAKIKPDLKENFIKQVCGGFPPHFFVLQTGD